MSLTRWKLTIQYDGSKYSGWQVQPDGVPSVQEAIETAITKFCGQKIRIYTAGRTDAGVHAHGQIAHFDLDYGDRPLTGRILAKALNAHLHGHAVAIIHAKTVDSDFHARFGAKNKLYRYRLVIRNAPPVMDLSHIWHVKFPLDIEAMRAAAAHMVGHHDFTSFRDTACQAKSPIRTLNHFDIITKPYDDFGGVEVIFELEAQSFLHHQVRNMVGTLMFVGKGKIAPDAIPSILAARDRTKAGPTAPSSGLSLVRIDYT